MLTYTQTYSRLRGCSSITYTIVEAISSLFFFLHNHRV